LNKGGTVVFLFLETVLPTIIIGDTMRIPDPIEILEAQMERLSDEYIDENTCMGCGIKVDYDLICMSPIGYGPLVCAECAGWDV